jgi:hypothetical protein
MPTGFDMNSFNDPEPLIDDVAWDLLSAYVDGEATLEESQEVEERLKADPHYLNAYNMLRATSIVAQDLGEIEPPAMLRAGILAATTQRRASPLAALGRYALAVGAVAAAAAAVGIFFMPSRAGLSIMPNRVAMNWPKPQPTVPTFPPVETHVSVKSPVKHSGAVPSHSSRDEVVVPAKEIAPQEPIRLTAVGFKTPAVPQPAKHVTRHNAGASHAAPSAPVTSGAGVGAPSSGNQQLAENYTPRPMMGLTDYRPAASDIASDAHSDAQPIRTSDDDASHVEVTTASMQNVDAQAPRVRFAKLLRSQLSSDSPAMLTGADIKRIRDASMYGFERPSTESLPHRQSAALVVGRF